MTFIPTEKSPPKKRWELTPEEWRLLMITFVGGLGSIVVGAATIGVAFALSRWLRPATGLAGVIQAATTVGLCLALVWVLRSGRAGFNSYTRVIFGVAVASALLVVLAWIGVAAGVH